MNHHIAAIITNHNNIKKTSYTIIISLTYLNTSYLSNFIINQSVVTIIVFKFNISSGSIFKLTLRWWVEGGWDWVGMGYFRLINASMVGEGLVGGLVGWSWASVG